MSVGKVKIVSAPKNIIQLTRALVHNSHARRTAMFYLMLGSLVMLFFGATFLDAPLRARPLVFIFWWGGCAWLMLASLLLAVFDILLIRAAGRRERRELARKILNENAGHHGEDAS